MPVYAVSGRVAGFLNRKQYLAVAHSNMLEHIYITVRLKLMHIPMQESKNRDPSFGRIEALRLSWKPVIQMIQFVTFSSPYRGWRSLITFETVTWTHHPKKVTCAELPGSNLFSCWCNLIGQDSFVTFENLTAIPCQRLQSSVITTENLGPRTTSAPIQRRRDFFSVCLGFLWINVPHLPTNICYEPYWYFQNKIR